MKSCLVSPSPTHGSAYALSLLTAIAFLFGIGVSETSAKPRSTSIDAVPTISSVSIQNGQLVASGFVTATIKGQTTTAPFSGVPVGLSLAADQTGAGACPILDLSLAPIELNLLGW